MAESSEYDRLDEISDAVHAAGDLEDPGVKLAAYGAQLAELEAMFARWPAAEVAEQLAATLLAHPEHESAEIQGRALAWFLRAHSINDDPWNLGKAAQIHYDRGEFDEASALCARVDTAGKSGQPFVLIRELALCCTIETRGLAACVDELRSYVEICGRSAFVNVVHFNLKKSLRADPISPPGAALEPLRGLLVALDKPEDDFFAYWFSMPR